MTRKPEESPEKKSAQSGSGKKSRAPGGRKFQSDFSWGEVDDVQQEEESLILPVKKPKKRKNRVEKIESTLTASNPQADLYKRKAAKRKTSAVPIDDDLALPSYGKHLEDVDDEFDIFLRRAEEAEKKEREPKKSPKKELKKEAASARKPKSRDESGPEPKKAADDRRREKPSADERSASNRGDRRSDSAERKTASRSPSSEPRSASKKSDRRADSGVRGVADVRSSESAETVAAKPSDTVAERLAAVRAKAAGKLRRIGYSDAEIRAMVPRKNSVEDAIALLTTLLDARLKLAAEPEFDEKSTAPSPAADRVAARDERKSAQRRKPVEERKPIEERKPVDERKSAQRRMSADERKPVEERKPIEDERPESAKRPKREKKRASFEEVERAAEPITPEAPPARRSEAVRKPVDAPRRKPSVDVLPEPATNETDAPLGFGSLELSRLMLESLRDAAYLEPSPIQAGTIPRIFAGVDLLGQSKTGSGKTAAFMIPIIEQIESCEPGNDPVALVVVPTRELAVQIRDETVKLSRNRDIVTTACYGGKPIAEQIKKMSGGVDIVVGTPGRLLDLTKRHALSFDHLRWVVLDEADRMLDIGFRPDIERILKMTPKTRQTLLFSATLPEPVVRLATHYMNEPETYDFSENEIASDTIEQYYITVDRERKYEALLRLLQREKPTQAIVFCRTKRMVDKLGRGLAREYKGSVGAIHGDLAQSQRDRIMRDFRAGAIEILVATDVIGRGIDVTSISHIINYDIPQFCDDYVHRVGRTGRMGREGIAFTLVTSQEGPELTRVEMRINRLLKRIELEGFEAFARPDDSAADEEQPKEQKSVFGKSTRRIRRAL